MDNNFAPSCAECQEGNFQVALSRKFKERMGLEIALSRRPRKAIADDMPCSQASLCDWLNTAQGKATMPAHWLAAWTREVGAGLLKWIAKENGLGLVDLEESGSVDTSNSAQLLALISQHHGHVLALIIQAWEEDLIPEEEKAGIWQELCRLIRELEAEAEAFRPCKAKPGRPA